MFLWTIARIEYRTAWPPLSGRCIVSFTGLSHFNCVMHSHSAIIIASQAAALR